LKDVERAFKFTDKISRHWFSFRGALEVDEGQGGLPGDLTKERTSVETRKFAEVAEVEGLKDSGLGNNDQAR
jgi:hypothetical protein